MDLHRIKLPLQGTVYKGYSLVELNNWCQVATVRWLMSDLMLVVKFASLHDIVLKLVYHVDRMVLIITEAESSVIRIGGVHQIWLSNN